MTAAIGKRSGLALAGPLLWAAHFFGLYVLQTLACVGEGRLRSYGAVVMAALTAVVAGCLLGLIYDSRGRQLFAARLQVVLAALSLIAVLWTALPLAWFDSVVCR